MKIGLLEFETIFVNCKREFVMVWHQALMQVVLSYFLLGGGVSDMIDDLLREVLTTYFISQIVQHHHQQIPWKQAPNYACDSIYQSSFVDMPSMIPVESSSGVSNYFISKIEQAELEINNKTQNLRRLEAQKNALDARGE